MEAFQAIVTGRISQHKADQSAKEEAQRVAMQAEADRKAKSEADAIIASERAKMEAEERAKVAASVKEQMEQQAIDAAAQRQCNKALTGDSDVIQPVIKPTVAKTATVQAGKLNRPSRASILKSISNLFGINEETALDWILSEFASDIHRKVA